MQDRGIQGCNWRLHRCSLDSFTITRACADDSKLAGYVDRVKSIKYMWTTTDNSLRLGENHFTLSALHSFLLDRVQVADYDSTLVSSILRVSKFLSLVIV